MENRKTMTPTTIQMMAALPGGLREHGASRHAGRDALSLEYPKHTASRNMARDNLRWAPD